jgi:hypothetical protein
MACSPLHNRVDTVRQRTHARSRPESPASCNAPTAVLYFFTLATMASEKPATSPDTIEEILDKLDLVSEELTIIRRSLERIVKSKDGSLKDG